MASLLIQVAQELEDEIKEIRNKYNYRINRRIVLGTMKDKLIGSLLEPNFEMEKFCTEMKTELDFFRNSLWR